MVEPIPLQLLRCSEHAVVEVVTGRHDTAHRLQEMGLRSGAVVEILQSGNPCVIRLDGQRLCLRTDDWASVLVRPIPQPHFPTAEPAASVAPRSAISIEATA